MYSAVRNAGGGIAAVVAMTSDTLDLSESNATCRIYNEYGETSVFFRHVNMDKVQSGYIGNGEKLSSSQTQLCQATCLAVA